MGRFGAVSVLALVLGAAQPTLAAPWSVGTNLDLTRRDDVSGSTTTLGLPGGAFAFQPGFRLGLLPGDGSHELFFNGGLSTQSDRGVRLRSLVSTVNYQYNASRGLEVGPYFTVGGGVVDQRITGSGGTASSGTSGILGAGMGIREWVAGGHATLRLEVRFDRIGRSRGDAIAASNGVSLRLGFDLWAKPPRPGP